MGVRKEELRLLMARFVRIVNDFICYAVDYALWNFNPLRGNVPIS
jgi:hypothetical protein